MSVFTVVSTIFMTAVVGITQGTSRVQNTADAGDGVRAAFLRMDRQVRYADSINLVGRGASGDWYVEFRTSDRADGQPPLCTQWRYHVADGTLQTRSWVTTATPSSDWSTVATRLQQPTTAPFATLKATAENTQQRLHVSLTAGAGNGASAGSAQLQTDFVARNSSASSPSNADANGDGLSDTPVCTAGTRT